MEGIQRSLSPVTPLSAYRTAILSPDNLYSIRRGIIEEVGKDRAPADREPDNPDVEGPDYTAGEREDTNTAV